MIIFYSWQNDIDKKINRQFIHVALIKAAKNLINKGAFENIVIDEATREVPGTPDIPDTILKKIDNCSIFIADITFIDKKDENNKHAKKRTPNPNVLIELGYAIRKPGFEKIITIFNSEFGKPEELPFDIRHRRPMIYKYNNAMARKAELDRLTMALENAILLIDKKTMSVEKIDFILCNREDGKRYGKQYTINGIIYRKLDEGDFIRGMSFNELRKLKEGKKLNEWQEYLYKTVKENKERQDALYSIRGMNILDMGTVEQGETKDYYINYMTASLIWLNKYKFDFLIKNNNEQTVKNVKLIIRTEKENRIKRECDLPNLPASSILSDMMYGTQQHSEQSSFQRKEFGNYIDFEYEKDSLYAGEEYILDEPLYITLHEQGVVKIEYTIFSDSLPTVNGILEINMKNEVKKLEPIDVFYEL
jgi:hypothetical protein